MKKFICMVVVLVMLAGVFTACSTTAKTSGPAVSSQASPTADTGPFAGVTPLAKPMDLNFGILYDSAHSFAYYLIDKLGGYKLVGITPKFALFANGPVLMEAVASWDCGAGGVGAALAGVIGHGIYFIGAAHRDYGAIQFFAPNDSPIVKAGQNVPGTPGLYGTAETWKGAEIYLPRGTPLEYTIVKGLAKFGLTKADVKLTQMDVSSVNTALMAGKCPVGGVWGNLPYGADLNKIAKPVMKAGDLDVPLMAGLMANPTAYNDPIKFEAIKKVVELYYKAIDWIQASQANMDQACEWFLQWDTDNGVKGTLSGITSYLTDPGNKYFTLKENYDMFTQKSPDGKMSLMEKYSYDPLLFFIDTGAYKPEDATKFLGGYFKGDIVESLYEAQQNAKK